MKPSHPARRSVGFRHPVWSCYAPQILTGIVDFMREHELWRLATENDLFGEMEAVKLDHDWRGEGLIVFRATEEELAAFRQRGQAVVLTSTEGPDLGFPRVVTDNAMIGALAAEHLIECSVPDFAFLARGETYYREEQFAPGHRRYSRERLGGFRTKLAEYGCEPVVHYLKGRPLWKAQTWREIETEVMAFLDTLPSPCGLFVADDSLGAVALRAADRLGRKVPGDLAVIGFGDDAVCCFSTWPALSSIAYPGREVGRQAAELLWRQMNGEKTLGGRVEIPVGKVIARESSDTLAIADPEIRELVRHIRLTAPHDALRVSELAERSPLSMTTIKARFSALLGHGPKQEIQRVRLRHLQHLLVHTDLSLSTIARDMNFGSAHELSRFFLTETGQRPTEYRESLGDRPAASGATAIQAVVFDMDGTLFDTERIYYEAYRRAVENQGGVLEKAIYFQHHAGTTNAAIEARFSERFGPDFSVPRFRADWHAAWQALIGRKPLKPLPGIQDTLELLTEAGIPLAIASSSDRGDIDLCLQASGLAPWFRVIASGDEVESGKPAPEIYQLACRRLGMEPACCLAIEDTIHGVEAALAAEMRVIKVGEVPDRPREGMIFAGTLDRIDRSQWVEILSGGSITA
ncbi:MAG: HAD-IA family hydrolase [Luteolibacter sp.]